MDFGGLDGLVSSDTNNNSSLLISSGFDPKFYETSVSATPHNQDLKHNFSKAMLQQQRSGSRSCVYSDSQNMLSFSSPTLPYYTGGYGGSMRGVIAAAAGGPFTPSQWMELEHQALIYKYITLNAPIPSNLLIPIKKSLPGTYLKNTTYGWGGFQLGFSNSSDPEPGRCRRTDGKKWRCSRDAVADQKYCERHMNRGRHRSRKPVEGQAGHSVSNGPTITTAAKVSASGSTHSHHHHQNRHQLTTKTPPATLPITNDNRNFIDRGNIAPSSVGPKQNPPSEFGFVCSDSLLNPLQKSENGDQKSQNSLRQFMDDWPQSEKTQLSISIPSDFMSTNSSPVSRNLSPLRMGLGVVDTTNERSQQPSWIPVSWESSMGGPLGEVLNHSTNNSPSALNLLTDGWESSQPQMTLSPTGVLQKTAFGCYSNSSTVSSPRTDNSLLGSTLITSSLPLL